MRYVPLPTLQACSNPDTAGTGQPQKHHLALAERRAAYRLHRRALASSVHLGSERCGPISYSEILPADVLA